MTNITEDIKYIGVNDREIDLFEGQYEVPNARRQAARLSHSSAHGARPLGGHRGIFRSLSRRRDSRQRQDFHDDKKFLRRGFH